MGLSATAVQTAGGSIAATTTGTATLGSTPTSGNFLVVCFDSTIAITPTISSTNTTWRALETPGYNTTGAQGARIFIGIPRASAGTVITMGQLGTGSSTAAFVVAEFPGANVAGDLAMDTGTGNSTSASVTVSAGSTANELLIVCLGARGTFSVSTTVFSAPTNSFSIIAQTNSTTNSANTDRVVAMLAKVVVASGSQSAAATVDTTRQWTASGVGLYERQGGFLIV